MRLKKMREKGNALLMTFMFAVLMSGVVLVYLDWTAITGKTTSFKMNRYRAVAVAEAGLHRIAWYLKNTAPDSSTNGTWRGTVTQTMAAPLNTYSYTAASGGLPLEGPVLSATSENVAHPASHAMDRNANTYWLSSGNVPQTLTFQLAINNDYRIYVGRIRMLLGATSANGALSTRFPRYYTWQISTNGTTWTSVVTKTTSPGNQYSTDVIDTFTLQQANYVRIVIASTQSSPAATPVNISEIEIYGVVVPATVSASTTEGAYAASRAVDNNLSTYWRSQAVGVNGTLAHTYTFTFPSSSNYSINKVRMRLGNGTGVDINYFPQDYQWDVSTDNIAWTNAVTKVGLGLPDITDDFNALRTNVNYLRLTVTKVQGPDLDPNFNYVNIGEIDIPVACISSSCSVAYPGTGTTVGRLSYYTAQNIVVNGTTPPLVYRQPKMTYGSEGGQ